MQSGAFDRYQQGHSPVHTLDPRIKVMVTIAFILSNALLPDGAWLAFGLAWLFILFANWMSGLGMWFTFKRSLIALPFALAAITVLFSIPGEPVASFEILGWTLVITDAGLLRFVSIVIRSWLSVQMAILLVAVTEFPKVVHALRHLRVPAVLTVIISFMERGMAGKDRRSHGRPVVPAQLRAQRPHLQCHALARLPGRAHDDPSTPLPEAGSVGGGALPF